MNGEEGGDLQVAIGATFLVLVFMAIAAFAIFGVDGVLSILRGQAASWAGAFAAASAAVAALSIAFRAERRQDRRDLDSARLHATRAILLVSSNASHLQLLDQIAIPNEANFPSRRKRSEQKVQIIRDVLTGMPFEIADSVLLGLMPLPGNIAMDIAHAMSMVTFQKKNATNLLITAELYRTEEIELRVEEMSQQLLDAQAALARALGRLEQVEGLSFGAPAPVSQ